MMVSKRGIQADTLQGRCAGTVAAAEQFYKILEQLNFVGRVAYLHCAANIAAGNCTCQLDESGPVLECQKTIARADHSVVHSAH